MSDYSNTTPTNKVSSVEMDVKTDLDRAHEEGKLQGVLQVINFRLQMTSKECRMRARGFENQISESGN